MWNLFFSGLPFILPSTCTRGSIRDGIFLLCTSSFLQFPTFPKPLNIERTLRRFTFQPFFFCQKVFTQVEKIRLCEHPCWRLMLHYRQQNGIDFKYCWWLCKNRTVSIDENMTNSLPNNTRKLFREIAYFVLSNDKDVKFMK